MSTKTTFKRVALVAVAALGLGVVSSIAPASATVGATGSTIVVGSVPVGRTGATTSVPVTIYLPSSAVATDTLTINAQISSAPISGGVANAASVLATGDAGNNAGARLALSSSSSSLAAFTSVTTTFGQLASTSAAAAHGNYESTNYPGKAATTVPQYALTADDIAKGYVKANVRIQPDVAGSYTVLVSTNASANPSYSPGDTSATFTLTTGSAPTGLTISSPNGSTILAGSPYGTLVKITQVGGIISGNEVINLTTSGSGTISTGTASNSTYATTATLSATDFSSSGVIYVRLKDTGTAAETISLTATGSGLLSSTVTATQTFSVVAGGSATAWTYEAPSTTATYAKTTATETSDKISQSVSDTSASIALTNTAANALSATAYGYVTVTDTAGLITGKSAAVYDYVWSAGAATAATGATLTWTLTSAPTVATDPVFTVGIPLAASTTLGVGTAVTKTIAAVARTNSAFTMTPATAFIVAPGASVAITGVLKDQFGVARSGQSVTVTTTGRNNPAASTVVTDASGKFTFTTTDASTSTTSLIDTVSFAATGATTKTVSISYANTAVGTLTVTGGNTTASVANATQTINDIYAGDGVENGAISITATVKDASGNALAGVPVTFSVAGTGVAFKSTSATVYTGATGTAVGSLYGWVAGTYTYTVAAGGKTTTGTATFAQTSSSDARTISADVSGNVVTATVKDRLGNLVQGATVYIKLAGGANVGGLFKTSTTTGAAGTAQFAVSGTGTATVYSNLDPSAVAGTLPSDQSCALAGNLTCASGATAAVAFTAATVGTATTAETYVGASIAPAGVNSASVSVTGNDKAAQSAADAATDAANEATDAANAATDAALAAADAADAATAAAQDASDAVASLASKVEAMVASLKAQITSLTNLVIKIQKKVKA
jgi:trimeric autotransporter adhesin